MMTAGKRSPFSLIDTGLLHRMAITPSGATFDDEGSAGGTWSITATREAGPFAAAGRAAILTADSTILTRTQPSISGQHTISYWAKAAPAATIGEICTGSMPSATNYSGHEIQALPTGSTWNITTGEGNGGATVASRVTTGFTSSDQRDGEWHSVIILFDGYNTDHVYLDGVEQTRVGVSSGTGTSLGWDAAADWRLNCTSWTDRTGIAWGSIADMRVYSRQVTTAEIARIAEGRG